MTSKIVIIEDKQLVGMKLTMSFANYRIAELWKAFSPRRKEIFNASSSDLYSLVIYSSTHFANFKPTNEFERWAAVEVVNFDSVPAGMETFVLPGGMYAVFDYKGLSTDHSVFNHIYGTWLPDSDYILDDRPHFEVLGDKYKNNNPNSEEEIWIPVKSR